MTILRALAGHYDRLASRGTVPPYGFSLEKISFAIVLAPDGRAVDVQSLQDVSRKKPRPSLRQVPRPVAIKRTSKIASNFLWDKTAYVLGAKRDSTSRERVPAERENAAFKTLHEEMIGDSPDEGLRALMAFLEAWRPEDYDGLPLADAMIDTNIVFRLDGERAFLHDRPAARAIWADRLGRSGQEGLCLVTGDRGPVARLHPPVKGVRGAQSSGASIVSFNLNAFESYAKQQGDNAPVSERTAFAYTTALNSLLAPNSRQRVQIGDATTVFWAEAADIEQAQEAEYLFSIMLAERPSDEEEAARVRVKLQAIADGRPLTEIDPDVEEDTSIYVLGLAPNAARLSIRFWHVQSIGGLAERIGEHWRDFRLDPPPWTSPPPVWQVLYETAAQRKPENIPPTLGGALTRSILTGTAYPHSLLATVIDRIRADKNINGMRAAICKAVLARAHRLGFEKEDVPVSLSTDEANSAYRLGRLFAVYERLQRAALGQVNATIKDRYYGAASATPASVFPLLERNSVHHLSSLRRADSGGLAHWFDTQIDAILSGLDTSFPRSFGIEDQGRFALGYHHQRAHKQSSKDSAEDGSDTAIQPEE